MNIAYTIGDVETTGLDPRRNSIVQLAAQHVDENLDVVHEFNEFIYPPAMTIIEKVAMERNRVDMIKVMSAPSELEIAEKFAEFTRLAPGVRFVAHNAPFDWAFLCALEERTGVFFSYFQPEIPEHGLKEPPWIDTLPLSRRLLPNSMIKNHQLPTLAAHFGFPSNHAHDALFDVNTLRLVWRAMRKL